MAARGPLPKPDARRRNAPAIPTTRLPATGRKGRAPAVPKAYRLGPAGRAWWKWAWGLPQAAAWDAGALYALARRAQLEDDLAAPAADNDDGLIGELLAGADPDAIERVIAALKTLKTLAAGRLSVLKEMRELDSKFGLTPKALAELRWSIVADQDEPAAPRAAARELPANVRRLPAVDPDAATG